MIKELNNYPASWAEHSGFMRKALEQARMALEHDDVPVGAVIVHQGRIVGRGHNQVEQLNDPTAHAEMIAITSACTTLDDKFLNGCTMYVTLEPCAMCAGAIVWSRVGRVVIGALDAKAGACGSIFNITGSEKVNHRPEIIHSVLEDECSGLLTRFFKNRRSL